MAYPTNLVDLDATRGASGDKLNSPNHITHHALEDDTSEAIQAKIGIDNSAVTTSLDYLLKNSASSNPGHKHTLAQGATDITASVANLNSINQTLGTGNSPTFAGLTLPGLTASELVATNASKALQSLAVATYPSLTELTYVKGVTSAIQTQLNGKQASDATLTSIAALGTAADKLAYTTGIDTWAEAAITAFGRSLIDDVDAATARATLGLVIGTDVQAYDATLQSISALGTAADKGLYTTGIDTWAEFAFTAAGRALLDDADAAAQRVTLGAAADADVLKKDGSVSITANWNIDGANTLFIDKTNGRVGIGTTGPGEKLEVYNGNILANRGNLKFTQETAPGAPTVAINTTAGNLNGTYTYEITFVTAQGETQGGTTSASVSPANQQVDLSAIPTGTSGVVTARKIYRTVAGGTQHKLVTTINDNTTTTYTDNIADGSLGANVPTSNTTAAGILVGGTNIIQIGQSGCVGIGLTNPTAPLEIFKAGSAADTTGGGIIFSRYGSGANTRASSIFHRYITGPLDCMVFSVSDSTSPYIPGTDALDSRVKMVITLGGDIGIGITTPTAKLDINSDILRLRTAKTPATAGAAGNVGDICWDANYLYICTGASTWRRIAHVTW